MTRFQTDGFRTPLCKEKRRYLPAEIFRGRLSYGYDQAVRRPGRV